MSGKIESLERINSTRETNGRHRVHPFYTSDFSCSCIRGRRPYLEQAQGGAGSPGSASSSALQTSVAERRQRWRWRWRWQWRWRQQYIYGDDAVDSRGGDDPAKAYYKCVGCCGSARTEAAVAVAAVVDAEVAGLRQRRLQEARGVLFRASGSVCRPGEARGWTVRTGRAGLAGRG